jgi:hypothetical protein
MEGENQGKLGNIVKSFRKLLGIFIILFALWIIMITWQGGVGDTPEKLISTVISVLIGLLGYVIIPKK